MHQLHAIVAGLGTGKQWHNWPFASIYSALGFIKAYLLPLVSMRHDYYFSYMFVYSFLSRSYVR
jgi:hypothetical protein